MSQAEQSALSYMQGDRKQTRLGLCRQTSTKKKRFQTGPRAHGATPVAFANDALKWREK